MGYRLKHLKQQVQTPHDLGDHVSEFNCKPVLHVHGCKVQRN